MTHIRVNYHLALISCNTVVSKNFISRKYFVYINANRDNNIHSKYVRKIDLGQIANIGSFTQLTYCLTSFSVGSSPIKNLSKENLFTFTLSNFIQTKKRYSQITAGMNYSCINIENNGVGNRNVPKVKC